MGAWLQAHLLCQIFLLLAFLVDLQVSFVVMFVVVSFLLFSA